MIDHMELSDELVRMAEKDRAVRAALSTDESLPVEQHPTMAELGKRNAERLNAIIDTIGWPSREVVGGACWAPLWLLLHAVGSPKVMRRGLGLPRAAERRGEVAPLPVALLEDRIVTLEGKPQQYGTQVDWDDDGVLNPLPIADVGDVDVRRRAVGLGPLAEEIEQIRAEAQSYGECAPADRAARKAATDAWARSVGWRD
jgi:hypothetical protein